MIEIEIQNETNQSQERVRFASVPRIGEGVRLKGPDGFWASFDVVDLWYQKAEFGDVWVPYLHVRMTEGERLDGDNEPDEESAPLKYPVVADLGKRSAADLPEVTDDSPVEDIDDWRMAPLNR